MDECKLQSMSTKSTLNETKLLMEGKGYTVKRKNVDPFDAFIGAYCLFSVNTLFYPWMLN